MKHKKTYMVEYWDKHEKVKFVFIKAYNEFDAERRFYKKDKYSLVRKTSLL